MNNIFGGEAFLPLFLVQADLFALEQAALTVLPGWSRSPGIPMGETELDMLSRQKLFKTNNLDKAGKKY